MKVVDAITELTELRDACNLAIDLLESGLVKDSMFPDQPKEETLYDFAVGNWFCKRRRPIATSVPVVVEPGNN